MARKAEPLHFAFAAFALGAITIASATGGCGSKSNGGSAFDAGTGGASSGASGSGGGGGDASASSGSSGASSGLKLGDSGGTTGCTGNGWKCKVDTSCGSSPTTLTGQVFDPAGANPLYNVVVFIPDDPTTLPAITPGTHSCNTCDVSIGDYVVAAQTDATGTFTLRGVPNAKQVPVTVQIGKWRRTTYIDIDTDCGTNTVSKGTLHLPGKRADGDMPQMAVLTGGCDDLGCFLTGMGIDPGEFSAPPAAPSSTAPHTSGRLDVYQGLAFGGGGAATLSSGTAGSCTSASCPLWASVSNLEYYDMALLSCECSTQDGTKPTGSKQALHDWLNEGGKVFASHYQYTWFENSPDTDFQGVASWGQTGTADTATGGGTKYDIDTSFPKGATFGKWLGAVSAIGSAGMPPATPPSMTLYTVADSVDAVNATPPQATVRWIYDDMTGNHPKYMSFGTPIGGVTTTSAGDAGSEGGAVDAGTADGGGSSDGGESGPQYCGKAVFTDLHTSGAAGSPIFSTVNDIPAGCGNNAGKLTPQQKALEFLFFDLSACVSNDKVQPPPIPNPPQ
jgi:hypothetical protein